MTATTQAPLTVPGSHGAHRRRLGVHPDPDPLGAAALVRPRRLRASRPAARSTGSTRRSTASRPLFDDAAADDAIAVTVDRAPRPKASRSPAPVGDAPRGEVFEPEDLPAAIAWTREAEAHLLRIPADAELDEPVVVDDRSGNGGRAHAHLVIEAMPNSHAHGRAAPHRLRAARAERRDHRPRRRPPRRRSPCSSGTTTPCTRHPTRPASSATRPSATSSSASAAASCA